MRRLTIEIPDGLSPMHTNQLAAVVQAAVERETGHLSQVDVEDDPLSPRERTIAALAIDTALSADESLGILLADLPDAYNGMGGNVRGALAELRERLLNAVTDPRRRREPTRAQELAADAMASLYGRSAVERQADGAVIIRGLLDDVEMASVCIEPDGRERWRRR